MKFILLITIALFALSNNANACETPIHSYTFNNGFNHKKMSKYQLKKGCQKKVLKRAKALLKADKDLRKICDTSKSLFSVVQFKQHYETGWLVAECEAWCETRSCN